MTKKLTNQEFILKAEKIHGKVYDYSLVEYTNTAGKVKISCSIHGVFEQVANTHLSGHGCTLCSISAGGEKRSKGWKHYADLFQKSHPDLVLVDFEKNFCKVTTKVPAKCSNSDHPLFFITPHKLTQGQGCPLCGMLLSAASRSISFDEFVKRAKSVHGDKYGYCESSYLGYRKKTIITCETHGNYYQTPQQHATLRHGCQQCSSESNLPDKVSVESYESRCRSVHGNKYQYDLERVLSRVVQLYGELLAVSMASLAK